ncbi:MAG: hypothetical protein AAF943_01330 [Pseudomonadota bacterium]
MLIKKPELPRWAKRETFSYRHGYEPAIPSNWKLAARVFLAIVPVLVVQFLFYLLFYHTEQMRDILRSIEDETTLQRHFNYGFLANVFLSSVIVVWRIHQVEASFLKHNLKDRFFLSAKRAAMFAMFICAAVLNPFTLSLFSPEVSRSYWELAVTVFYFGFYAFVATPALHEKRRGQDWTVELLEALKDRRPFAVFFAHLRGRSSNLHYAVLTAALATAVAFTVLPGLFTQYSGAPTALFTFVWCAFAAVFWIADHSSWVRMIGFVLFLMIATGSSYGVREIRQDPVLSVERAPLEVPPDGPVFIVVADGGGIRSAYWSTALLDSIAAHQDFPDFKGRIVAYGGTSGGSVGVGLFAALVLADTPPSKLREKAASILSIDYVSLAAAHLFWRDFVVSAFCLGKFSSILTFCYRINDRITALERRMEQAFEAETGHSILSGAVPSNPRMFFVATEVGTGRAYVLTSQDAGFPRSDTGVRNPATLITDRVPMSTAMFVSARFPVISPDGRITVMEDGTVARPASGEGTRRLDLIDGGYADNTGSIAVPALLDSLDGLSDRLHVISITNNPLRDTPDTAPFEDLIACPRGTREETDRRFRLLGSPLSTLEGVRSRASEILRERLRERLGPAQFITVPFIECEQGTAVPLGWTLSRAARTEMTQQVDTLVSDRSPLIKWLTAAYER